MTSESENSIDSVIDSFLSGNGDTDLCRAIWILRPMMAQAYAMTSKSIIGPAKAVDIAKRRVRATAAAFRRVARVAVWEADGAIYLAETINERRAMQGTFGSESMSHRAASFRTTRMHLFERPPGAETVQELGDSIRATLGFPTNPSALFVDHRSFAHAVAVADRSYRVAVQFLSRVRPKSLVVATQQNVLVRGAILAARDLGIPSIYFPHAPVAHVPWYEDLPTDYVGLRGVGEQDFYTAFGVDESLLNITGVPAIGEVEPPEIDPELPSLVALSPIAPASLRRFIDVVGSVVPRAVVAPHPRQSRTLVKRFIPAEWEMSDGGLTIDLIRLGHPRLILHNSGVAWESLRMGIPTIHVALAGSAPSYAMFGDGAIDEASNADELSVLVERPLPSIEERQRIVDAAMYWGGPLGEESRALARGLIRRAQDEGPRPGPIWDRWGDRDL